MQPASLRLTGVDSDNVDLFQFMKIFLYMGRRPCAGVLAWNDFGIVPLAFRYLRFDFYEHEYERPDKMVFGLGNGGDTQGCC